jgi:hypothetical protein
VTRPRATKAVRDETPGFLFVAEAYWDLEWTLQQQGFDYTCDKRLYDRFAWPAARASRAAGSRHRALLRCAARGAAGSCISQRTVAPRRVPGRVAWQRHVRQLRRVRLEWSGGAKRLAAVNYSDHQSQCYAILPWGDPRGGTWRLSDRIGPAACDRDGNALAERGVYLDMPRWGHQVFDIDLARERLRRGPPREDRGGPPSVIDGR